MMSCNTEFKDFIVNTFYKEVVGVNILKLKYKS